MITANGPSSLDLDRAVAAKALGAQYHKVLDRFGITHSEFFRHVTIYLSEAAKSHDSIFFLSAAEGLPEFRGNDTQKRRLEEILENENKRAGLFVMEEPFLRMQYDRIVGRFKGERQKRFFLGTLIPGENKEFLAYYGLSSNIPVLASGNRARIVRAIDDGCLPGNLVAYLEKIKLSGLVQQVTYGESGVLQVIELLNHYYQRRKKFKDLFAFEPHLHKWDFVSSYFADEELAKRAVYHTLTEDHPELKSRNRKNVVTGLINLPEELVGHLSDRGLGRLLYKSDNGSRTHSVVLVLRVFDAAYRDVTGDCHSLFDESQHYHVKVSGNNRIVKIQSAYDFSIRLVGPERKIH